MSSRHYNQDDNHKICKELIKTGFKRFDVIFGTKSEEYAGYWIDIYDEPRINRLYGDLKTSISYIRKGLRENDHR